MKSLIQEIFPTELYIFDFNEDEIQPVIEIANKIEQDVKKVSDQYPNELGGVFDRKTGLYFSDYRDPVRNVEYEKLLLKVADAFLFNKKKFEIKNYWHAYYTGVSQHVTHIHQDKMRHNFSPINYSSVLSLSNTGGTRFFSSNYTSEFYENTFYSSVGRMIIFPAHQFHEGVSTEGRRCVISSNLQITDLNNDIGVVIPIND